MTWAQLERGDTKAPSMGQTIRGGKGDQKEKQISSGK